jgi:hypothetical protein
MLKSKRFVKKTKRGAVLTVTAEHYLRKDIWCGYTHCTVCKVTPTPTHTPTIHNLRLVHIHSLAPSSYHPPSASSPLPTAHSLITRTSWTWAPMLTASPHVPLLVRTLGTNSFFARKTAQAQATRHPHPRHIVPVDLTLTPESTCIALHRRGS